MNKWLSTSKFINYSVSNTGLFKNNKTNNILKPRVTASGYLCINIRPNGKYDKVHNLYVHREVALAFIPNPFELPQVNHKDGVKTNNHIDNLEWCTASQNAVHAYQNKLRTVKYGNESPRHTLTEDDVRFIIGNPHIKGCDLAAKYNVSRPCISRIRNGIHWNKITNINANSHNS